MPTPEIFAWSWTGHGALTSAEPAFTKDVKDSVEKYFHLGLPFENDPSDLMRKSDTLPA